MPVPQAPKKGVDLSWASLNQASGLARVVVHLHRKYLLHRVLQVMIAGEAVATCLGPSPQEGQGSEQGLASPQM